MDGLDQLDGHPTRYTVVVRKRVEVNTDPQRRCYNGCYFSSEMTWTPWQELGNPATRADGEDTIAAFQKINPQREYALLPPTNGEPR